jgi:tRNA nucleotidyltransferase (CCA-adding enzyme)
VQKALAAAVPAEQSVEMHFKFPDHWHRRLFIALCRRHGLEPYRYRGQRHTTVVVRAPGSFINNILWPEFLQIKDALNEYLNEATERIIREEVYSNSAEAAERKD